MEQRNIRLLPFPVVFSASCFDAHAPRVLLLLLADISVVYAVTAVRARTLLAQNIANGPTTPNPVGLVYA